MGTKRAEYHANITQDDLPSDDNLRLVRGLEEFGEPLEIDETTRVKELKIIANINLLMCG